MVSSGRTSLLSDAPPSMSKMEPGRNRRVHWRGSADGVSWTDSLLLPPCDGIERVPDGQTQRNAEKRRPTNDACQEQDGCDNCGDGPNGEDKPQPAGLRVIQKPLVPPTAPVESISRHATENCSRQNCWNVHHGVNPPNVAAQARRACGLRNETETPPRRCLSLPG